LLFCVNHFVTPGKVKVEKEKPRGLSTTRGFS
jgi:hypothetical protein